MADISQWIDPAAGLDAKRAYVDEDGDLWICRENQWLYTTDVEDGTIWSVGDPVARPFGRVRPLSETTSALLAALD